MAITVTLDDIRAEAERRYGNVEMELPSGHVAVLRNYVNLSAEERANLAGVQTRLSAGEDEDADLDMESLVHQALSIVAGKKSADELRTVLGLGGMLTLFARYGEASQVGEAERSTD